MTETKRFSKHTFGIPSTLMRRLLAFVPWLNPGNDLGLLQDREYKVKHSAITSLKLHPKGNIFVAGGEDGSLWVFDATMDADGPKQYCILSYKYGGVSEICWMGEDLLAVGTTRGRIVTFSIRNEQQYLLEVASIKAHGDGAAQIAVDGLDYSPNLRCLVSVAEGVGSIKLWGVSNDGKYCRVARCTSYAALGELVSRALAMVTTAYNTPRYVTFLENGSKLLVGFMENSLVQIFKLEPFVMIQDVMVGRDEGQFASQMGNALALEKADRLVVLCWQRGKQMYELTTMKLCKDAVDAPALANGANCNQGLASLKAGAFLASVDGARIRLWRATDGATVGSLKVPGRNKTITAIHATTSTHQDVLVAASTQDAMKGESTLSVWRSRNRHNSENDRNSSKGQQLSTIQLALLCIIICVTFQVIVQALPKTALITWLVPPYSEPPTPAGQLHAVKDDSATEPLGHSHQNQKGQILTSLEIGSTIANFPSLAASSAVPSHHAAELIALNL